MTSKAHEASLSIVPPLDPTKLVLGPVETDFLKRQTDIQDDDALRRHILAVQEKAYAVFPYPCIYAFSFLGIRIVRAPAYERVLQIGRDGGLFLDIGCCFGTDSRKLVDDGFPAAQVIASDYHAEFWQLGNELFKTTSEQCGIRFISGDVFDDVLIDANAPKSAIAPTSLATLGSLTPCLGHISAIYASAFFHLFSEEKQALLARRLLALLKPRPGSVIFGQHVATEQAGILQGSKGSMFCHCPETWRVLWTEIGEEKGLRLEVKTSMEKVTSEFMQVAGNGYFMEWEVSVV